MKRKGYLIKRTLLNHISVGKKPILLIKKLNISKQLLSYHLSVLKKKGVIRKITNGLWVLVKELPKDTSKRIRAHAFIWKIKFNIPKNWEKREQILKKLNIPYVHAGNTIRIKIKGKKVWLNNKGIVIYEPKSFFQATPLETRKMAIYELQSTVKSIENKLKVNFGKYLFAVKREHYALVKNKLAEQVNKEGDKIYLYDKGEWWGVVDKSMGGDEFEFFKTNSFSGLVNSTGAQGYFNSQKNTNWKVTPEFVLKVMDGIQKNQLQFAENMTSHVGAIKTLGKEVRGLGRAISKVVRENKDLKLKVKNQKTLLDY